MLKAKGNKFIKVLSLPPVLNISGFWIILDSVYVSGSKSGWVLDIPGFWICPWFWIYQDSEYTRVLDMPGFRICRINSWICLNMSYYVWICLEMPEYAGTCVNMPKSAWMTFVLHSPIYPFVFQSLFYLSTCYLFERLQETRGYSLKEHEAVFWKKQHLIFCIAAGSISFIFCIKLNNLYKKDLNFQLLFTAEENKENREEGGGGRGGGWILICPSSVVLFLVKTCKEIT